MKDYLKPEIEKIHFSTESIADDEMTSTDEVLSNDFVDSF